MPDRVKEKLVELLNTHKCPWLADNAVCPTNCNNCIADTLIVNGVTVQQWIPVKDRLPEDNSNVLGCLKIGEESRIYPAFYAHGVWWDRIFSTPTTNSTTHWMPLPQPPKEE